MSCRGHFSTGRFQKVLADRSLLRRRALAVRGLLELLDVNHDVFSAGAAAAGSSGMPTYWLIPTRQSVKTSRWRGIWIASSCVNWTPGCRSSTASPVGGITSWLAWVICKVAWVAYGAPSRMIRSYGSAILATCSTRPYRSTEMSVSRPRCKLQLHQWKLVAWDTPRSAIFTCQSCAANSRAISRASAPFPTPSIYETTPTIIAIKRPCPSVADM